MERTRETKIGSHYFLQCNHSVVFHTEPLKKCVQSQTFVMWRLWQIIEETKECNTTTYLAVVADIAVPPSASVVARGGVERVHAFLSVAGCGSVVRPSTHTHKTDVCNRRFNVWSRAKTDLAPYSIACLTRPQSAPAE